MVKPDGVLTGSGGGEGFPEPLFLGNSVSFLFLISTPPELSPAPNIIHYPFGHIA